MTKKTKSNNNINNNKTMPKMDKEKVKIIDIYKDIMTFREKPVSLAVIERLSEELNSWSLLDTSLRFKDFYLEKGIPTKTVYRWKEKYEFFNQTYELALNRIASRREIGALTRKYDAATVERFQPLYDSEYKEFIKWKAEIKDRESQGSGTIVVQMAPAPKTALVPERFSSKESDIEV